MDKKTLTFEVAIDAPRALVWDAMLSDAGYRVWAAAFSEGCYYVGSWDEGAAIRFLAPSGDGMVSEIAEHRPHEFVSIRHLGETRSGVDDTTSGAVRAWAPAYETYACADLGGGRTAVRVTLNTLPAWEDYMLETFPKALARLKALCEDQMAARA